MDNLPPIGAFVLYCLRLGAAGFGGPIALAGYMLRDLVAQRQWVSKEEHLEGLALALLAPGPLAAQLAIYPGWLRAVRTVHPARWTAGCVLRVSPMTGFCGLCLASVPPSQPGRSPRSSGSSWFAV
jgi:chromate transport protein ChrA